MKTTRRVFWQQLGEGVFFQGRFELVSVRTCVETASTTSQVILLFGCIVLVLLCRGVIIFFGFIVLMLFMPIVTKMLCTLQMSFTRNHHLWQKPHEKSADNDTGDFFENSEFRIWWHVRKDKEK